MFTHEFKPFSISNCGVLIMPELKLDHWCSCRFNGRLSRKLSFIKWAHYLYYHCIFPYVAALTMTRLKTNYYNKSLLKHNISFFMAIGPRLRPGRQIEQRSNTKVNVWKAQHFNSIKKWSNEVCSSQGANRIVSSCGVWQQKEVRSTTVKVDAGTWMLAGSNTEWWAAAGRWRAERARIVFVTADLKSQRSRSQTRGNLLL